LSWLLVFDSHHAFLTGTLPFVLGNKWARVKDSRVVKRRTTKKWRFCETELRPRMASPLLRYHMSAFAEDYDIWKQSGWNKVLV
jgi:hypothetical protein